MTDKALAIVPRDVAEVRALSDALAKSNLLPPDLRGKAAEVFVTVLAGLELGMPPMAALRGIHVIKGKPVLSADAMVGVVLGRGVAKYFHCVVESDTEVTYETWREGAPEPKRGTWSIADAKRANLDGDNWRKYPRAMLKARCKSWLARDVYPDILAGCYDESEADEIRASCSAESHADAQDAEIVDEVTSNGPPPAPPTPPILDMIEAAETEAQLRGMAGDLARLTGSAKDTARRLYGDRLKVLRDAAKSNGVAP